MTEVEEHKVRHCESVICLRYIRSLHMTLWRMRDSRVSVGQG